MNYRCMDEDELLDNGCKGVRRFLLSAPARLVVILFLGEAFISVRSWTAEVVLVYVLNRRGNM